MIDLNLINNLSSVQKQLNSPILSAFQLCELIRSIDGLKTKISHLADQEYSVGKKKITKDSLQGELDQAIQKISAILGRRSLSCEELLSGLEQRINYIKNADLTPKTIKNIEKTFEAIEEITFLLGRKEMTEDQEQTFNDLKAQVNEAKLNFHPRKKAYDSHIEMLQFFEKCESAASEWRIREVKPSEVFSLLFKFIELKKNYASYSNRLNDAQKKQLEKLFCATLKAICDLAEKCSAESRPFLEKVLRFANKYSNFYNRDLASYTGAENRAAYEEVGQQFEALTLIPQASIFCDTVKKDFSPFMNRRSQEIMSQGFAEQIEALSELARQIEAPDSQLQGYKKDQFNDKLSLILAEQTALRHDYKNVRGHFVPGMQATLDALQQELAQAMEKTRKLYTRACAKANSLRNRAVNFIANAVEVVTAPYNLFTRIIF